MSVKKYSLKADGNTSLSEHFKVKEFRSHCNGTLTTDDILISEELVAKLEELMALIGCNKAVITSGYRDAKCDKLVGGSGVGQHVCGRAVDIIFYQANGYDMFDAKYISCKAQDLGFTGIARITERCIHLDVRTNGKYYGDELAGHTNTVTSDFYSYYGIAKEQSNRDKVQLKFGFANSTMDYLSKYTYSEDLFKKLLQ